MTCPDPSVPQQTELREGPVGESMLRRRALELALQRARRSYRSVLGREGKLGKRSKAPLQADAIADAARRVRDAERAIINEALVALGGKPLRRRS